MHLNAFELPEEQAQFTSLPNCYHEVTDGQYRIVILKVQKPVGFFLLHSTNRVKEYSENPHAMLLTALSINFVDQGKGYGKGAMSLLKEFVSKEFPSCNEIVLAVNHKNIAAQQMYRKVGFQDTGKRKTGPIGKQFIMSLRV
ncbi:N-acetyltransferase [Robertmurraya siralis]|uniref:N-acetyltransferase n=1 Tax=Robertmurraya siralis TaxID=77777 RepID=A0A919WI02_9BACI|nr:GNAT family N-acetyltransferase [Robertmurraya siralis]GIN62305.1 N-acetyltransferase [Robertmurraya siralis]